MHSVNLQTKIKSFSLKDLEKTKKLINIDLWEEYYSNEFFDHEGKKLPITIVPSPDGHPFCLVELDKINLSSAYSQEYRNGGENPKKSEIRQSLSEKGYFLDTHPIKLRLHEDNELSIGCGYTRLELLMEQGFKNAICVVYKSDQNASESEANNAFNQFFFRDNAAHRPAGNITKEDVAYNVKNSVIKGDIPLDKDAIRYQVNAMTASTSWNKKTKEETAAMVYNSCSNNTDANGVKIITKSYTTESAKSSFLINYPDTATKKYMVFSTSSTKKIAYAVSEELKKHNKKILIVLHTARIDAFDLEGTFIKRINDAVNEIEVFWESLSHLFNGANISDRVEIHGAIPAVSSLTPNMSEMIVFGVNDSFLHDPNYVTTKNRKSISDFLLNEDEDEEETEMEY